MTPQIEMVARTLDQVACDVLVVNLFEGVKEPGGATGAADAGLGGLLRTAIAAGDLTGKLGETAIFYTAGRLPARKVLVAGLGSRAEFDLARARRVAAVVARAARQSGARTLASVVHGAGIGGLDPLAAAAALVDGTLHGVYRFRGYRSEPPAPNTETLLVVEGDPAKQGAVRDGVRRGAILGRALTWARDLANTPGNHLTPARLAEAAQEMARDVGLECTVLGPADLAAAGLQLLLSVARGSEEEPRCVVLRHRGGGGKASLLGLVGKGLTFDSGGISIKPTDNMWDMKFDMCGAAAVLGAMRAVAEWGVAGDVLAVVPCAENMPDGRALKPGDVVTGLSGRSVEIRSTDAEGRLVLADGLAYAVRQGAQRLITASTLTGGANIALGSHRFAIMANDDGWYEQVVAAVAAAGELGWRLPHDREYRDLFKSEIADMTNGGKREASTIQGGLFLLQHVGDTPTVHLDIAATAWTKGNTHQDPGATGSGLRSLAAAAEAWGRDR